MSIRRVPVALIGFGNSARRLAELLLERAAQIEKIYQVQIVCTAISTAKHGSIIADGIIDLAEALKLLKESKPLTELKGSRSVRDSFAAIEESGAEIMVETTPLNIKDGEPARSHIELALNRGMHVVTANKGPLAFAARELRALAAAQNLQIRYESTVMDGAPVFNLVDRTLPLVELKGMRGIINSTTNFILTEMEQGKSYEAALSEAQARGIAEADPALDVEGWDAAVKAAVLANCLMGADIKPYLVKREGILDLKADTLISARNQGKKVRLVTRVERYEGVIKASVAPEEILPDDLLYFIDAFSNALILDTDLMGTIAIVEQQPDLTQTAYGLLSDIISVVRTTKTQRAQRKT